MTEYETTHLKDLEEDMADDYKAWRDAEKELEDAKIWRDKMALNYAESTVKYFDYKKDIENK